MLPITRYIWSMPCLIYCLTNKINGKKYVGQTWQSINRRLGQHKNPNGCIKIHSAIEKYGMVGFDVAVLATVDDQEKADQLEMFWVAAFDCVINGYNISPGGRGHKTFSDDTLRKMSEAKQGFIPWNKGKQLSEEHKKHVSENHARPCLGMIHSEESRKKMSATLALGGKAKKINQSIADSIRADYDTDNYTMQDLADKYGISRSNVCLIINRKIWQ